MTSQALARGAGSSSALAAIEDGDDHPRAPSSCLLAGTAAVLYLDYSELSAADVG